MTRARVQCTIVSPNRFIERSQFTVFESRVQEKTGGLPHFVHPCGGHSWSEPHGI